MYKVDTIDQCKKVLKRLKEKRYVVTGYSYNWQLKEGFQIEYINSELKLQIFLSYSEDVQNYFIRHGTWGIDWLPKVKILSPVGCLKKGQICSLVYDYGNGKYLVDGGNHNVVISSSITEIVWEG